MDKLTQIFNSSLQTGYVDKTILSNIDYMLLFITWLLETLLLFVVPIIYSLKNLEDR